MISIVICSRDSQKFSRVSAMYQRLFYGGEIEIIPIHDATGLAEGYNRGLRLSRGDPVIFSHDDVQFLAPDFHARLIGHMQDCDLVGVAGTRLLTGPGWIHAGLPFAYGQIAYPNHQGGGYYAVVNWSVPTRRVDRMQALDGLFLCVRRSVAAALGFDEKTFRSFFVYDMDFTFRAFLAGYRLAVACDLLPLHDSEGRDQTTWEEDRRLFVEKFAARLPKAPAMILSFNNPSVFVSTVEEVVRLMTPLHWDD